VIPFSVLDLSPICQGGTASDAFRNTLDLARQVERLGYQRYWMRGLDHQTLQSVYPSANIFTVGLNYRF